MSEDDMHRYPIVLLALLTLLAACSPTATVTPTLDPSVIQAAIIETQSAQMADTPVLVAPADGATFDTPEGVLLEWQWTRPLMGNEAYDVRVWQEGAPHNGITWSEDDRFDLANWLSQQPQAGTYYWSVVVVGGTNGQVERVVTNEAGPFHFTVNSNALPTATPTLTPTTTPTEPPPPTPTPYPIESILTVPDGFRVEEYARPQNEERPTLLAFGPDDQLYVLWSSGKVVRLEDQDGDHYAETEVPVYLDEEDTLNNAVGLAWHDGVMYISDGGRISTLTDSDGDGMMDTVTPIITGLVTWQYWGHSNNGIAFGPDGKLYVGVGSTSDHGPIKEPMEALIMRMNPDGSDVEVFARGFRNPYDLTFSPDGALFTADNNPDSFGRDLRWLPPEELNHVREGEFYGFPTTFGDPPPGDDSAAPITLFYPSVGTAGLVYYAADQFPPAYRDGVYVAEWGTGANPVRARDIRNGFAVVFVPLTPTDDGTYSGDWNVFAQFDPSERDFRPVDVTVGSDGALYILEYLTSAVYRVTYTGEMTATAMPEPTVSEAVTGGEAQGETLFREGANGAPACVTCHLLDADTVGVGPSLVGLSDVAGERVEGLSAEEYVHQSIVEPNAHVVDGYLPNIMYQEYGERLTDEQIDALVAYVLGLE
jgi:glucose/arabinose dehydrogenase